MCIRDRFYRVDPSRSRSSGGTGLGLAIVRHVVINHQGSIALDSTEGTGSTFTILLPQKDPPETNNDLEQADQPLGVN